MHDPLRACPPPATQALRATAWTYRLRHCGWYSLCAWAAPRAPGASLPSCRRLQKQKDDTLKKCIFEYTDPEPIQPSKRLHRGVGLSLAITSRNAADARPRLADMTSKHNVCR